MLPTNVRQQKYFVRNTWIMVLAIILLSAGIKVILMVTGRLPFNADEAIVGLMASHILKGEIPVFFWGQAYMGSLDALLVAGAFAILGKSVVAIRVVQILLYSGTIATTCLLAYRISQQVEAVWMAGLLMAVPVVNMTLYTTISLGGYGEALLLGNLILLTGFSILSRSTWLGWFALGFLTGFGLWVNGLTLVYSLPVIIVSLLLTRPAMSLNFKDKDWKAIFILISGLILGAFPWLYYGLQNGFGTLMSELMGSAIASQDMGYLSGLGTRLVSFLLFGLSVIFGFRPPWEIRWLALPLIPLVAGIWVLILIGIRKSFKYEEPASSRMLMLWGVMLTLTAGFIFTSFGNDPSGRYFLPFGIMLAIFAGIYLVKRAEKLGIWRWIILAATLTLNLIGTLQCWISYPPGFTTQFDASTIYDHRQQDDLVNFLKENSLDRGFTTYWIAYPLAFLSDETMIYIPRLPYHRDFGYTQRDSRYGEYETLVRQAEMVTYITARQPWLDDYLRSHFAELGITWKEKQIGDFQIFFALERVVQPEEIGLVATE
jgi:4-amino-4-deoxy-L-arabinose transferase-like glycosyltransferase